MAHWTKRTTPQGKVYYGNAITHETTWNYNDIDPTTGRLVINFCFICHFACLANDTTNHFSSEKGEPPQ